MSLSSKLSNFLDGRFILVVEPSNNYRTSIKNYFSNLKQKNVRYVRSVAEARREMLVIKVGLFVSEWQMSEKNGLEFCREIRKDSQFQSVPFLLLSTENMHNDVILASEGGINSYLIKPFSYSDFCAQLVQLIEKKNSPSSIHSLLERADLHLKQKDLWVAETLFNEALSIKPTSAIALCGLGCVQMERSNVPSALIYFQKAITNNPEYVESYKFIIQIAESRSDQMGILHAASILHDLSPENPRYALLIACAQLELNNQVESEKFFKLCIRLSPLIASGYKGIGNLYLIQKEYKKSQKALERALDLDSTDVSTLNSLGTALVRLGKVDDGILKYRIALSLNASDARVLFNLGLALEVKGELKEALTVFRNAMASDPKYAKAQKNIDRIEKVLAESKGDKSTNLDDSDQFLLKKPRDSA